MDNRTQYSLSVGEVIDRKREQIRLLEKRNRIKSELPHLYGFPFYQWADDFFEAANPQGMFLCAANQISKSSTQIRKSIHWATAKHLWPKLWTIRPLTFWYLYPSSKVATIEFEKKWTPEFLPRGKMKKHPVFGWRPQYRQGFIEAIHFNSGVSIYFKTYGQSAVDLQTGTVWALFFDEEMPVELWDELLLRVAATDGYIHGVFTPTLGQPFWEDVMEKVGKPSEKLKGAWKRQVSMYDCLKYADGSPTPWNRKRIARIEAACKSPQEVLRRVHGRFVRDTNLKYAAFNRDSNFVNPLKYEKTDFSSWRIFTGVDYGSGGQVNHPAAVCFVAVNAACTKGVVFRGKRFDGEVTTADDCVQYVEQLCQEEGVFPEVTAYDYSCKDLQTIAGEMGWGWVPAEKNHAVGEAVLNVLFKNGMLEILDLDELDPLGEELASIKRDTPKTKAKDDFADALRYAVTQVQWDWSVINTVDLPKPVQRLATEAQVRREQIMREIQGEDSEEWDVETELAAYNELYEDYLAY